MTDFCGGCGKPLTPAPLGGHYYCCAPAYWTEHAPLPADRRGAYQLGQEPKNCKHPTKPLTTLWAYRPIGILKDGTWWK